MARSGLIVAALLLGVPVASAPAAEVSVLNGELSIRDVAGESNVIDVVPSGANAYFVLDQAAAIAPGAGCTAAAPILVNCGFVTSVRVVAGAGDDLIGLNEVTVPVVVDGEGGDDLLEAGAGAAVIDGGAGIDSVLGGSAEDRLSGGPGDDLLAGGASDDTLAGNSGDDIIGDAAGGEDTLKGGGGDDLMRGGTGDDTLNGGAGDDVLVSGNGGDEVDTGTGRDRVIASKSDKIDCDSNDDVSGGRPGCGKDPGSVPMRWPPLPEVEEAHAASAPAPQRSLVRQPGMAKTISVRIPASQNYDVAIHAEAYDKENRRLGGFDARPHTRQWASVNVPPRLRPAYVFHVRTR
jgi:hypothetical protein